MKNILGIDCRTVLDSLYESDKDGRLSTLFQVRIWLHLLLCSGCSKEKINIQCLENIMKTEFFPPSPDFEEPIMRLLDEEENREEYIDAPTGFSFRGWVIIGFFMLLSLASVFFGMNFIEISKKEGLSFLIPVGITIGMVLTCYGAMFIGSHLKELSMRFRLR